MGGGSLAQMVWGTYFEKNCSCSKGHLLGLGGLNPCQDGLGHLCSENWSSNGICSSRSGNKVPQSARLSEGGGGQSLFGQCPNRHRMKFNGASLSLKEDDVFAWRPCQMVTFHVVYVGHCIIVSARITRCVINTPTNALLMADWAMRSKWGLAAGSK